jgi:hypothetical protein
LEVRCYSAQPHWVCHQALPMPVSDTTGIIGTIIDITDTIITLGEIG